MNISGINGAGAIRPYSAQKSSNAESSQLKTKLQAARKDVTNLEKSLSAGGGNESQIKAELAKKEQEIRDLEKKIQELDSKKQESNKAVEQNQNTISNGTDVKEKDSQQTNALENVSSSKDNSKLISGSVIDEYV